MRVPSIETKWKTALLLLLGIAGVVVILDVEVSSRSKIYTQMVCSTPNATDLIGRIHGKVVDSVNKQPVGDATITIKNLSPDKSICPDVQYLTEEDLITDSKGYFDTNSTAHYSQELDITISATGCKTTHQIVGGVRFAQADYSVPNAIREFYLECGSAGD